jgi:hypothetical protein
MSKLYNIAALLPSRMYDFLHQDFEFHSKRQIRILFMQIKRSNFASEQRWQVVAPAKNHSGIPK